MKISNTEATQAMVSARKAISKIGASFRSFTKDEVDDLVQTSMIKAIESFDTSKGTFGAIAYMVARTVATDYLRGRLYSGGSKLAGLSNDGTSTDEDGTEIQVDLPDHAPTALDMMISSARESEVATALGTLSATERSAISTVLADERAMTGAERIARQRAIASLQESCRIGL
jgi:DNA-directed RNA polymerase specialized sigma24 family protein